MAVRPKLRRDRPSAASAVEVQHARSTRPSLKRATHIALSMSVRSDWQPPGLCAVIGAWPTKTKGLPDRATNGERDWWVLPAKLNDLTKEAVAVAVDRGWMIDRGDSVCLTDAGRNLAQDGAAQQRRYV